MDNENEFTGADIVLKALKDQEVDTIFGYPGGAVLPIYISALAPTSTPRVGSFTKITFGLIASHFPSATFC